MAARTLLLYLTCGLLVAVALSQSCNDAKLADYAKDFPSGSMNRWLYENVAPGAECLASINVDLTDEEKCNEFLSNQPDSEWVQYDGQYLDGADDIILTRGNYGEFLGGLANFPLEACIDACRVRTECKSIDWSYGYDKCKIQYSHGEPIDGPDWVSYLEKPTCPDSQSPYKNSSMSFFRLAMKLAASGRYDMALEHMNKALQANRWNKLYYWGSAVLTLLADGFSAQSVSDARAVINRIGSAEYPATPEVVTDYLSDLNAALSSPNVALSLAQAYEGRFDDDQDNLLAGNIAAIAYLYSGNDNKFKSILEAVLNKDADNMMAVNLYISQFGQDYESLNALDEASKNRLKLALTSAITNDPNNPVILMKAAAALFFMQEFADIPSLTENAVGTIDAAYTNGLISDVDSIVYTATLYAYCHLASLYRYDKAQADRIEVAVETLSKSSELDLDSQAAFALLRYRMLTNRYSQFAFEESPAYLETVPLVDIGTIIQVVDNNNGQYAVGKLSQYMYRQALVTQQLRNGTDTYYADLVQQWEILRNKSVIKSNPIFERTVNYNLQLLHTEKALMEGNKWSDIFGENGFLNLAAQLVAEITDAQYIVMPLDQIIAYAAIKLSQEVPAPLGRVSQGTNLPADLTRALYGLQLSWPRYTPSRLNTEAFLQLALNDVAGAQATLDIAAQKMVSASIPWLQLALDRVRNAAATVPVSDLGDSQFDNPDTPTFNTDDQRAWNNLDKNWAYSPELSAMDPCTAYRYKIGRDGSNGWNKRVEKSILSTKTMFYFSTNVQSCQLRCLFESAFTCKAFTFGFNRCLLHDQQWSEVSSGNRLSSLLDEDLYEVPDCVQGETNAYSQTLLGIKAMSNYLADEAMDKFDEAIEMDSLMGMPKIMKAYLMFRTNPCDITEAVALLKEEMQLTDYEFNMAKVINNTIHGRGQDALNYIQDLKDDNLVDVLVLSLENRIRDEAPSSPSLAQDYITLIAAGSNTEDNINSLRALSPLSPRPDLFEAYGLYEAGDWAGLLVAVEDMEANDNYIGFGDDSYSKMFAMQMKHYAHLQLGQYNQTAVIYKAYQDDTNLGAFIYAAQVYTLLTDQRSPVVADPGIISEADVTCADSAKAAAWVMNGAKLFSDSAVDSSIKQDKRNSVINNLPTDASVRDIWRSVLQAFYNIGDGSTDVSKAEDVKNYNAARRAKLSPPVDLVGSGLELVNPDELLAWAVFTAKKREDYQNMLDILGAAPTRSVSLWLRFQILKDWRSVNDDKRKDSIDAANALLTHWSESDKTFPAYTSLQIYLNVANNITTTTVSTEGTTLSSTAQTNMTTSLTVNNTTTSHVSLTAMSTTTTPTTNSTNTYKNYPDPPGPKTVNFKSIDSLTELPMWAIIFIIAVGALIMIALVATAIVWAQRYSASKKEKTKKKLYSGSIHSTSTAGFNSRGENVLPGQGEVMYGGMRNDGFSDGPEMDFKN